jgi:prepilin-type N-terminal cleavage/methylation domain-containing protein
MVAARKAQAGFTLTELMVVVVILALLAAVSTPMFTKDNSARKGRGWANVVAQTLQRARFQAMGDRTPIHVLLYRNHIDVYREDPPVPPSTTIGYTLLTSTPGPVAEADKPVAIWDVRTDTTVPSAQNSNLSTAPSAPTTGSPKPNEIIFTTLGSTRANVSWRIYLRNERLAGTHPDAAFLVRVGGLTGFVTANDKVVLP